LNRQQMIATQTSRNADDDLTVVASMGRHGLNQPVLRTDVAGMPLEWIDYREAARLYTQDQVAYACGSPVFSLYGGTNAVTGRRTVLDIS